jgi:hypothetical protein
LPGDVSDDTGLPLTAEEIEEARASFEHWICEHTNNSAIWDAAASLPASERCGGPDADRDAGWY